MNHKDESHQYILAGVEVQDVSYNIVLAVNLDHGLRDVEGAEYHGDSASDVYQHIIISEIGHYVVLSEFSYNEN